MHREGTPEHAAWLDQVREPALEPDLRICDPHHHLWDRGGYRYLLAAFAPVRPSDGRTTPHQPRRSKKRAGRVGAPGPLDRAQRSRGGCSLDLSAPRLRGRLLEVVRPRAVRELLSARHVELAVLEVLD